jgi:hypothetical protein
MVFPDLRSENSLPDFVFPWRIHPQNLHCGAEWPHFKVPHY